MADRNRALPIVWHDIHLLLSFNLSLPACKGESIQKQKIVFELILVAYGGIVWYHKLLEVIFMLRLDKNDPLDRMILQELGGKPVPFDTWLDATG